MGEPGQQCALHGAPRHAAGMVPAVEPTERSSSKAHLQPCSRRHVHGGLAEVRQLGQGAVEGAAAGWLVRQRVVACDARTEEEGSAGTWYAGAHSAEGSKYNSTCIKHANRQCITVPLAGRLPALGGAAQGLGGAAGSTAGTRAISSAGAHPPAQAAAQLATELAGEVATGKGRCSATSTTRTVALSMLLPLPLLPPPLPLPLASPDSARSDRSSASATRRGAKCWLAQPGPSGYSSVRVRAGRVRAQVQRLRRAPPVCSREGRVQPIGESPTNTARKARPHRT